MAALGTGWNFAQFDNFRVRPVHGPPAPANLALGRRTTSSSAWSDEYDSQCATDGQTGTRWNAASGTSIGEWLEVDFGNTTEFNAVRISQFGQRITRCHLEYLKDPKDLEWKNAWSGSSEGKDD